MALFSNEFNNLNDLLVFELKDLYDAEHQITDALPKMTDAACDPRLKSAFDEHLRQTQTHITRLEKIFNQLGQQAERETCAAMKGLLKEGNDMISAKGDDTVRDAGLISAAQRVEHYEMASYGTVRTLAHRLGYEDIAQTLQQTLNEEGETDKKLTAIAESGPNIRSPQGEPTMGKSTYA
jgi:ferritin-like metal-binding protein YciE